MAAISDLPWSRLSSAARATDVADRDQLVAARRDLERNRGSDGHVAGAPPPLPAAGAATSAALTDDLDAPRHHLQRAGVEIIAGGPDHNYVMIRDADDTEVIVAT